MADKKYRLKSCLNCPASDSADWSVKYYCRNYRNEDGDLVERLLTNQTYSIPDWCQLENYDSCGKGKCICA